MKPTVVTICCLVLIHFISDAYGCRCVPETKKQKYCRSTIVSRGLIQTKNKVGRNQFEYTWSLNYNFKFRLNDEKFRSARSSSKCGVNLQVGVEYLISGDFKTRYGTTFMETNSCNWIEKWNDIPLATEIDMTWKNFTTCYS